MLCCVIPILVMVAGRAVYSAANAFLGREGGGPRSMPPPAQRMVAEGDRRLVGAVR